MEAISTVLPAFNEEANLPSAASGLQRVLQNAPVRDWEIVIIDDGSRDRTGQLADDMARTDPSRIRVLHNSRTQGYARTLRQGFSQARHELVFYMDSDNQFDSEELPRLLALIEGADMVCGYRMRRADGLHRRALSTIYNWVARGVFGRPFHDANCAFRLFRRSILQSVTLESEHGFLGAELLGKATRGGFRVVETGVRHYPRSAGRSSIRPIHVWLSLVDALRVWRKLLSDADGR